MPLVRVLMEPYINELSLGICGKYHCVCFIVIDLRCMLDLPWDYPVPDKSKPLSILLEFYL